MIDRLALCYHAVSPTWPEHVSVSPSDLEQHLRWLLRRGYHPSTFADAVATTVSRRTLAVTFDDGYRSVYRHGFPVLRKLGVTATVYVCPDLVGRPLGLASADWRGGPHEAELEAMDWDEISELAEAGWEIGSHTSSHPMLTSLDDAQLARELRESRDAIEAHLGQPCRTLAYPYGDVDRRVAAAARDAGYEAAGTLYPGYVRRPSPWQVPRIGVSHHQGGWRFRVKAAATTRRLRSTAVVRIASGPVYKLAKPGMTLPRPPEAEP
jgi:peptidoglycan/xylan/chitin deacetylase (PgdA/CDA1 family)